jgi:hypothetical protein
MVKVIGQLPLSLQNAIRQNSVKPGKINGF